MLKNHIIIETKGAFGHRLYNPKDKCLYSIVKSGATKYFRCIGNNSAGSCKASGKLVDGKFITIKNNHSHTFDHEIEFEVQNLANEMKRRGEETTETPENIFENVLRG